MKTILLVTFFSFSSLLFSQDKGQFTDTRDGKIYKTIKIGNQIWMTENLKYKPQSGNYFIYNNDQNNFIKYGYLYDWNIACNVCPSGWKLPSNADFIELANYLGNDYKSKMMLQNSWTQNDIATNESGFSAVPAGLRNPQGVFSFSGQGAYFWTNTAVDGAWAYGRELGANAGGWASKDFGSNKSISMSVRCIKSNDKIYKTAKIGDQVWMAENLTVTKFRNGDDIPRAKSPEDWYYACENQEPMYCYLNNDPATATVNGILYNWWAINDIRGIAPEGWRIPSHVDIQNMDVFINSDLIRMQTACQEKSNDGLNNEECLKEISKKYGHLTTSNSENPNLGITKLKSKNSWGKVWCGTDYFGFSASPTSTHYVRKVYENMVGDKFYSRFEKNGSATFWTSSFKKDYYGNIGEVLSFSFLESGSVTDIKDQDSFALMKSRGIALNKDEELIYGLPIRCVK